MQRIVTILVGLLLGFDAFGAIKKHTAKNFENHAVILVHGWGRTPRKPLSVWESQIKPYTDLSVLKKRFQSIGFKQVFTLEYDDLQPVDMMALTVRAQIEKIIAESNNPNLRLDVVGHSMGHFVAAKAILEKKYDRLFGGRLADRVRIFIGLAGIVRGQDQLYPCTIFPGQCGGGGALEPYYRGPTKGSAEVRRVVQENFEALDRLKKCSVYSEADEIVKTPYDSGSFRDLGFNPANRLDVEIKTRREKFHKDVKDSEQIFQKIISNCYQLIGKN